MPVPALLVMAVHAHRLDVTQLGGPATHPGREPTADVLKAVADARWALVIALRRQLAHRAETSRPARSPNAQPSDVTPCSTNVSWRAAGTRGLPSSRLARRTAHAPRRPAGPGHTGSDRAEDVTRWPRGRASRAHPRRLSRGRVRARRPASGSGVHPVCDQPRNGRARRRPASGLRIRCRRTAAQTAATATSISSTRARASEATARLTPGATGVITRLAVGDRAQRVRAIASRWAPSACSRRSRSVPQECPWSYSHGPARALRSVLGGWSTGVGAAR